MRNPFKRRPKNLLNSDNREIDPDEILIDASNLPSFDTTQFEGRLEKPISRSMLYSIVGVFILVVLVFIGQAFKLQIFSGQEYRLRAEKNTLRPVPIFAGRGVIVDRNGQTLVWNAPSVDESADIVATREYATTTGLSHLIGYVRYPSKDKNGFYYRDDFEGVAGVEKYFDDKLKGSAGSRLVEVDAFGKPVSTSILHNPIQGRTLELSIDSKVQSALFNSIRDIARQVGFSGGAGVVMDVQNGELLALASYPEYSSAIMSNGSDKVAIKSMLNDPDLPFLDRAVDGLYTPGSIIKPYVALGALSEKIIDPNKVITTTGSISIPNPYDSTKSTVFRDWKNLGSLDMRHAIAMSSDVYFYTIGGGYGDQKGLGIERIDKYLKMFGFGTTTLDNRSNLFLRKAGTIPTPEWKKATFNEDWYLGNTYHTAIGQYGFQVTLIQIVRAVAAVANGGQLLKPSLVKGEPVDIEAVIPVSPQNFEIVREGMRASVEIGTSKGLNVPYIHIAGKSGTAELGVAKDKVNSWITGFWPYEKPKYAFVVMMEKGSVHNLIGAVAAMRQTIDWMKENTPEYFTLNLD